MKRKKVLLKAYPQKDAFFYNYYQISNSTAFRRLQWKTQVFPDDGRCNPHVRNRSTHSLEVVNISRVMARLLGLNEDLAAAIAIGHDVGHVAFGHLGERFLSEKLKKQFFHSNFSSFLLTEIEKIPIESEVLDGIQKHSFDMNTINCENWIPEMALIPWADKFSVIFSDFSDIERNKYGEFILPDVFYQLGRNREERVMNCIKALVEESKRKGFISFYESQTARLFDEAKTFMYQKIYRTKNEKLNHSLLECAWEWILQEKTFSDCSPSIILSMMTDREVRCISSIYSEIKLPSLANLEKNLGFMEFLEDIRQASPKFEYILK